MRFITEPSEKLLKRWCRPASALPSPVSTATLPVALVLMCWVRKFIAVVLSLRWARVTDQSDAPPLLNCQIWRRTRFEKIICLEDGVWTAVEWIGLGVSWEMKEMCVPDSTYKVELHDFKMGIGSCRYLKCYKFWGWLWSWTTISISLYTMSLTWSSIGHCIGTAWKRTVVQRLKCNKRSRETFQPVSSHDPGGSDKGGK